jgi:AcrR family transcriptional regulator
MKNGRPRNPDIDIAIRQAALDLVVEKGYRGVSIEGIAARSGVSKQTVYRRYRSRGEVILDALVTDTSERLPPRSVGSLRADLGTFIGNTFEAMNGRGGPLNRALMVEALQDEEFAVLFRDRHIAARRAAVSEILHRARERGEAVRGSDDLLIDMVFGPMWYRLLIGHGPLDRAFADELADAVATVAGAPVPAAS